MKGRNRLFLQTVAVLIAVLAVAAPSFALELIWSTGSMELVTSGSNYIVGGFLCGTSEEGKVAMVAAPFRVDDFEGTTITQIDAVWGTSTATIPAEIKYIIWQRNGFNAPTVKVAEGTLGPYDEGMDDPNDDYYYWGLHTYKGLNIPLPQGDYYLSIYGSGVGPGNTAGYGLIAWTAGGGLQDEFLERQGIWICEDYPNTEFIDTTVSWTAGPYMTDADDLYNPCFTIYGEPRNIITGSVKVGGVGVPGAYVCAKAGTSATAEPRYVTQTDGNGNYTLRVHDSALTPWNVAVWKEGWAPTTDSTVTISGGNTATLNFTLDKVEGKNLARSTTARPVGVFTNSEDTNAPATYIADGSMNTKWTTNGATTDVYLVIDLDPTNKQEFDINGVTIYWADGEAARNFTVQVLADDGNPNTLPPDPNDPLIWDFPDFLGAVVTNVFETTNGMGGLSDWFDNTRVSYTPIRFAAPVKARAIRIRCTATIDPYRTYYGIFEVQAHAAAEYISTVYGVVKDTSGNAIKNALVHLTSPSTSVFTSDNGFYSFIGNAGKIIITADAIGYRNEDKVATMTTDGNAARLDFALPVKPGEVNLVPNGDFEEADPEHPYLPKGWTLVEAMGTGATFIRDTMHNSTPGGTACCRWDTRYVTWPSNNWTWAGINSSKFPIKSDGSTAYNLWMSRSGDGVLTYINDHIISWYAEDGSTFIARWWIRWYDWGRVYPAWNWWVPNMEYPIEPNTEARISHYRLIPPAGAVFMAIEEIGGLSARPGALFAVDDVTVEEVDLLGVGENNIQAVKSLPVDSVVTLRGKRLTAWGVAGESNIAYIEEPDRSSGMRVDVSKWIGGGPGDTVNITGYIGVTPQGEKYIYADQMSQVDKRRPLDALGMNNKTAAEAMSQGLYVKLWGKVTASDDTSFTISDGSPVPIKVICGSLTKPGVGQKVRVRGIMSTDGTAPVLLMRDELVDWTTLDAEYQPLPFPGAPFIKALRDYLIIGPFFDASVTPDSNLLDIDFISRATGGAKTEANIKPKLGEALGTSGKSWTRNDGASDLIDLNVNFGATTEHAVAYAYVCIWSPTTQLVDIPVGSDDWFTIYVNGVKVGEFRDTQGRGIDYGSTNVANVTLQAGFNDVLIKVVNGGEAFGFVTQFAEPGTWTAPGIGNCVPKTGLGYLLQRP